MRNFIIAITAFIFTIMPHYIMADELPICTAAGMQNHPAIYGDRIVWEDGRDSNTGIYIYDFADQSENKIPTNESAFLPDISGNWVVWKEAVENWSWINLYAYNIATLEKRLIETEINIANIRPVSISGAKIVYDKGGSLYLYNLTNGSTERLGEGTWAKIEDTRVACLRPPWASEPEIYIYDLEGNESEYITNDLWIQKTPDVFDSKIIWSDNRRAEGQGGIWDIIMYDLDTDLETNLTSDEEFGYYRQPAIDRHLVVWQKYDMSPEHDSEIYLYNLLSGTLENITNDAYHQSEPQIDRGRIVYTDTRNGLYSDIYMYAINMSSREIDVNPIGQYNFGDVTIGEVEYTFVTISNIGGAPLYIYDIKLLNGSPSLYIFDLPKPPPEIQPNETVYLQIIFKPDSEISYSDTLQILSDDVDENMITIDFNGTGVLSEIPPDEQIQNILSQCADWIMEESLFGSGHGNSSSGRLKALLNMIESAGDFINQGMVNEACNQLDDVYKRTDGIFPPPDFVDGDASSDLAEMITNLRNNLNCQ